MTGEEAVAEAIRSAGNHDDSATVQDEKSELLLGLAKLTPLQYDVERKAVAEQLGLRLSTLDKEVERIRAGKEGPQPSDERAGTYLESPEPWPETVDGAALAHEIGTAVSRYLVLPDGAADIIAAWVLHAHLHDTASISPILAVTSPSPECGKTTLLELLAALVPRPLPTSNVTTAALFRAVEKWHPTVLIDEADTFLSSSEELRGVLNSGHRRSGAFVIRTVGEDHEPRQFMTWAPKAIALIGRLPATLESRSIEIALRRKTVHETVEGLRHDRVEHLEVLRRRCARLAQDIAPQIRVADPDLPPGLHGRSADNWRHLVAIADTIGGDFARRIREAATSWTAERSEQTAGIVLLEDIRAIFSDRQVERVPSAELATTLGKMEDRPWSEWKNGTPITVRQIARVLEPFGIAPIRLRVAGYAAGTRGYELAAFSDAFDRYLSEAPIPTATTPQARDSAESRSFHPPQREASVAHPNGQKPSVSAGCGVVADRNAPLPNETPWEDLQMAYDERAAILEFVGDLPRAEAEARAARELGLVPGDLGATE